MSEKNPQVDEYLELGCGRCSLYATPDCKVHTWSVELVELRRIVLDTAMTEERKWGVPCYTIDDKNILLLNARKEFCSFSFFKGALMEDPADILIQPTENSQAVREIRFTDVDRILELEETLKDYLQNAIEIEKAGLEVQFKKTEDFDFPEELREIFEADSEYEEAFYALTPGRQRGYLLHFSGAKQSKTRTSRIKKARPQILEGIGFHDRY